MKRSAAFLAAGEQPDLVARVVERVQHGQITLAGNAKSMVDTMDLQLVDKDLAAATGLGTLGHGREITRKGMGKDRPGKLTSRQHDGQRVAPPCQAWGSD
jgi:hypothetical protein